VPTTRTRSVPLVRRISGRAAPQHQACRSSGILTKIWWSGLRCCQVRRLQGPFRPPGKRLAGLAAPLLRAPGSRVFPAVRLTRRFGRRCQRLSIGPAWRKSGPFGFVNAWSSRLPLPRCHGSPCTLLSSTNSLLLMERNLSRRGKRGSRAKS